MKITCYLVCLVIIQTILLARINFFGIVPDLFLLSIIIFAVLEGEVPGVLFAMVFGLTQDWLSSRIFYYTVLSIALCVIINIVKERFLGERETLIYILVTICSPLILILQACIQLWGGLQIAGLYFGLTLVFNTLFNLLLVPIVLPIMRRVLA